MGPFGAEWQIHTPHSHEKQTHKSQTCGRSHRQQEVLWVIRTNEMAYLLTVRKSDAGMHRFMLLTYWLIWIFDLWLQFQPDFNAGSQRALTLWYGREGKGSIRDLNRGKKEPNLALAHEIRAPSAYHRTNNHQTRSPWYATVINSNKGMNNSAC